MSIYTPVKLLRGKARKERENLLRKEQEAREHREARRKREFISRKECIRKGAEWETRRGENLVRARQDSLRAERERQESLKREKKGWGYFPFVALQEVSLSSAEPLSLDKDYYMGQAEAALDAGDEERAKRLLALVDNL